MHAYAEKERTTTLMPGLAINWVTYKCINCGLELVCSEGSQKKDDTDCPSAPKAVAAAPPAPTSTGNHPFIDF